MFYCFNKVNPAHPLKEGGIVTIIVVICDSTVNNYMYASIIETACRKFKRLTIGMKGCYSIAGGIGQVA
jgi:hypothetical protein